MRFILLIIVIILLIGALPSWPYGTGWGYYPAGAVLGRSSSSSSFCIWSE